MLSFVGCILCGVNVDIDDIDADDGDVDHVDDHDNSR